MYSVQIRIKPGLKPVFKTEIEEGRDFVNPKSQGIHDWLCSVIPKAWWHSCMHLHMLANEMLWLQARLY